MSWCVAIKQKAGKAIRIIIINFIVKSVWASIIFSSGSASKLAIPLSKAPKFPWTFGGFPVEIYLNDVSHGEKCENYLF
jgi:hypothetical protein